MLARPLPRSATCVGRNRALPVPREAAGIPAIFILATHRKGQSAAPPWVRGTRTPKALKGRDSPRPRLLCRPFRAWSQGADSPRAALRSALGFIVCGPSGLNARRLSAQQYCSVVRVTVTGNLQRFSSAQGEAPAEPRSNGSAGASPSPYQKECTCQVGFDGYHANIGRLDEGHSIFGGLVDE
jgi:hypothetical protein